MNYLKRAGWFRTVSVLLVLSLAYFTVGCACQTRVNTDPRGADVYVDGEQVGTSPTTYDAESGPPNSGDRTVVAKKEGYKDAEKTMERSELNVTNFVVGLVVLGVPAFLWGWDYPESINLQLQPEESSPEIQSEDKSESKNLGYRSPQKKVPQEICN